MKIPDFSYYVSQFFNSHLSGQKNVSQNTIISYATTFKQFLQFCEEAKMIKAERMTLSLIDENLVIDFLDWLEKTRKVSMTTRNQRLVALHSFFRYVQKNSPIHMELSAKILNIPYKKAPRTVVSYLCENDMRTLLAQPSGNTREGFRDMVLLSVLYDTGARVQELVDIKVKHIRLDKPAVVTLHGKGNKTRQVPIMPSTVNLLRYYLASSKGTSGLARGDTPLFANQRGEALSRWGVSHIIDKYVRKAQANGELCVGFPITPHVFRHSKAMHMLHAGINLFYIRDILGHVDVSTTEIYARADTEMKRKAIEASCEDILPAENFQDWNESSNIMSFLNSLC